MPSQRLVGAGIERSLATEHGGEESRGARAVERKPVVTAFVVKLQLVLEILSNDAARSGVGDDNNGGPDFFECLQENIELVAAKLVEHTLLVTNERKEFFLLGLPVYEEVDMLEMRFANFRHLVHALEECIFLVDELPNSHAGVDVFRMLGDIAPAVKCFRLNLLELRPAHNRANTLRRKRRIHADKQETAVLEVVIKDGCIDIVAYAEMLPPNS